MHGDAGCVEVTVHLCIDNTKLTPYASKLSHCGVLAVAPELRETFHINHVCGADEPSRYEKPAACVLQARDGQHVWVNVKRPSGAGIA